FIAQKIYLTNGFGTVDPAIITHAISSNVASIMDPYRFARPPRAYVSGIIPMRHSEDADLHFQIDGGPFQWWKLTCEHISGTVDWVGEHLALSDISADLYDGKATVAAIFDFHPRRGTDFAFALTATNTVLQFLM